MMCPQAQQGERHTNVVVEIALGRERSLTLPSMQDAGNHLCDRGFAVAARHRNQWQLELRSPCLGQLTQCLFGVGHFQAHQTCLRQTVLGDGGFHTKCGQAAQVGVRIKTLTLQRHKQIICQHTAAVGVHTRHRQLGVAHQSTAR